MKIGLLVGSLRKASWNRKVAEATKKLFPEDVEVEFIEVGDLPLYNQDYEVEGFPESYKRFWNEVEEADGYIFFTPEYNRSLAPALKNALDIGSRDPKGNPWGQKHAAIFSASPGGMGGLASNLALRQVFVYLDLIPIQQPEVYLANVNELFEGDELKEDTKEFLQTAVDALLKALNY